MDKTLHQDPPFLFKAKGREIIKPTTRLKTSAYASSKEIKNLSKKIPSILGDYPVRYVDSSPLPKKLKAFNNVLNTEEKESSTQSSYGEKNKKNPILPKESVSRVNVYNPSSPLKLNIDTENVNDNQIPSKRNYLIYESPIKSINADEPLDTEIKPTNSAVVSKTQSLNTKKVFQPIKMGKSTTIEPFSFETRKRKREEIQPVKFVSMAEIIKQFEQCRGFGISTQSNSKISKTQTKPITPKLRTKVRGCRPTCALKEHNLNLQDGQINQVKVKQSTALKSNLQQNYKAKKCNVEMELKPKKVLLEENDEGEKENVIPSKTKTLDQVKCPITQLGPAKITKPQPFSFFDKDVKRFMLRDERLKKEKEFALKFPNFKAQPLPSPTEYGIPEKKIKSPTHPEPFNLLGEYQRQLQLRKFQKKVEEQIQREAEAKKFYAQPCLIIHNPGFEPIKSDKPTTEAIDLDLYTEQRAIDREAYDAYVKKINDEIEEKKRIQEEHRKEKIRLEEIEIRKHLVHKASDIIIYPPVFIKPSTQPLTVPISPNFVKKKNLTS